MSSTHFFSKESTLNVDSYFFDDSVFAELNNNLFIIDAIIADKHIAAIPEFYILGGAALVLHGLDYPCTLDIDTANKIADDIKSDISEFIDDNASEVTKLGIYYQDRAVEIRQDLTHIRVFLLSMPDLLITKLYSGRRKDINALLDCKLAKPEIIRDAVKILATEYTEEFRNSILSNLNYLMELTSANKR